MTVKSDMQIHIDVAEALRSSRFVHDDNISIAVSDGVVTLGGWVPSYPDRLAAANAVRAGSGVRTVVEKIRVELPEAAMRDDDDLTRSVADALLWHVTLGDGLRATVVGGEVTLGGDVEWTFQAGEAMRAVTRLEGVVCVIDRISVRHKDELPPPSMMFGHAG